MTDRERQSILEELTPPFDIHEPATIAVPLVFSSPHSGRTYPSALIEQSRLSPASLRKSEDAFVDELMTPVTGLGAPLIAARFPRVYLDVNREPYELDPELFRDSVPTFANTRSARVAGGLGTIARIVADSEEIYRRPLAISAAFERIDRLYRPYHDALAALVERARQRFGLAVLVDCHSMPSVNGGPAGSRPDFVIGDRFGTACDPLIAQALRRSLVGLGYEVAMNRPYAGGYITEHYGQPGRGVHAIQIEINRALYMHEPSVTPAEGFATIRRHLELSVASLIAALPILAAPRAAAAE
ncbi:MAG: N-formylglutamate amidohydrolase [Hyphomicrobiaceae bacterium]